MENLKANKYLLFIVSFALLFFLYKLGASSLQAYDEAWYGAIARNVIISRNPWRLEFNQRVFTDHPNLVFNFMALSQLLFGQNEFGVRFFSAFCGAMSIGLIYLIGRKLFSHRAGIYASLGLVSSLWFVLRARSGNLDIPFTCFYLLTIYLLINKQIICSIVAAAALFMSKTLIGLSVAPIFIVHFLFFQLPLKPTQFKTLLRQITIGFSIAGLIILPWYIYNQIIDPNFLHHHFFDIGLRGGSNSLVNWVDFKQNLLYLHSGIGKWFKPALLSSLLILPASYLFKHKQRQAWFLTAWFLVIGLPLLLSAKTEVWHLIPLYPPLFLALAGLFHHLHSIKFKKDFILDYLSLVLMIFISFYQLWKIAQLAIPWQTPPISDEAEVSLESRKYVGNIYLKSWFFPIAVYYSRSPVEAIGLDIRAEQKMAALTTDKNQDLFIFSQDEKNLVQELDLNSKFQNSSYILASDY